MLELLVILMLGLLPLLLSPLWLRRAQRRWQARLQQIRARESCRYARATTGLAALPEVDSYSIGERSCRFNARSPHLRCAVNPGGPCDRCSYYQPRP